MVDRRVLDWPDCRNVRDIGGLPLPGGKQTRDGALVRADTLDRLTEQGLRAVRDFGVSAIVDIRSPWEIPSQPHPFAADPAYQMVPFIDASRDEERNPATEQDKTDLYHGSLNRNGRRVAEIVRAVATAAPGAVVVHCLSGVDRTGLLVALILDSLGAEKKIIVEDYANTGGYLPDPESATRVMRHTLEHIEHQFGDSAGYLRAHGVTSAELAQLADRLTE